MYLSLKMTVNQEHNVRTEIFYGERIRWLYSFDVRIEEKEDPRNDEVEASFYWVTHFTRFA